MIAEIGNRPSIIGVERTAINQKHSLVQELWALVGQANEKEVYRIANESGLPLNWIKKMPTVNGNSGTTKLMSERNILLLRNRKSNFIDKFQHPLGRCAKFFKLSTYNNCNYWCEYCYLYLTFRTSPISTHFVNYDQMFYEIAAFDRKRVTSSLRVLNLGELGDPLAVDDVTGFSKTIVPYMPLVAPNTKLLFLTKSNMVDNLLGLSHGGQTIVSFSVNTDAVHGYLEHRTPTPVERLEAAKRIQEDGYEVRLRIDPVFYYSSWKKDYKALVEQIFSLFTPSRITIGEYRPAAGLLHHIEERFPSTSLLKINGSLIAEAGKLRYPQAKRIQMFRTITELIRKHNSRLDIALCKEDKSVWRDVGLSNNKLCCNCLG